MRNLSMHTPSVLSLFELLQEDMKEVETHIQKALESHVSLIGDVSRHLICAGGKRLRPLLVIACARLCGYTGPHDHELATSVELIHHATLFHDDVMDNSAVRRGRPTAHRVWDVSSSILVGDFLLSRAFELMIRCHNIPILKKLSQAATQIIEGQVLDLTFTGRFDLTEEDYLQLIQSKTACLFQVACEAGGMLAGMTETDLQALGTYGAKMGLAFQMVDDVLDYTASFEELGKPTGTDFYEGKATLPVILAYQQADEKGRQTLIQGFQQDVREEKHFLDVRTYLEQNGAFEKTFQYAHRFADEAIDALKVLGTSPLRKALEELALFVVARRC